MSQLAKFAIVGDCSRCSGRYSTILRNSFPRAVYLAWTLVLVGILSFIGLPSEAEAAEVCHINLQGDEFDAVDEDEVDGSEFDFVELSSMYQDICMPRAEEEGTVSQVSQSYRNQGFFSLIDLPLFRDSGIPPTLFAPYEVLFHSSFDFDEGVGRALVIGPSVEVPTIIVLSTNSLTIGAVGSTTYTVRLRDRPSEPVRINLVEIPNLRPAVVRPEVSWSPTNLEFTTSNWDMPKTVHVSSSNPSDSTVRGFVIEIGHYVNGSQAVAGIVRVTVEDDGPVVEPGVHLSVSALTIDEGGSETYIVVLESNPDPFQDGLSVTVTPDTNQHPDVSVSPSSLTFTRHNWNAPQEFTVSAAHDDDAIDDTATIIHAVSGYGTVTAASVSVTVEDDDPVVEPGVHLSVSALTIDEGGSGTYTVVLESNPDGNVIVTPSSNNADVAVSPEDLTFTANDWSDPQTVTVSAAHDEDVIVESVAIAHSVAGYGSVTDAGAVEVTVNEVPPPVAPPVEEVERAAVTDTLATVTAAAVSNVTANIGARFSAARGGTSISVGGQPVTQFSTLEGMAWSSPWNRESHTRALSSDDLLRSTDFQIVLGASESTHAQAAETWTFWGRGDLQYFSSQPSQGSSYDGDLRAGYLGLDTQVDDQWLAGVAVSRTMAEANYSLGMGGAANDGTMDVTLTSLIPYVRFAPDAESELWAIVGAGQGAIENSRPGTASDRVKLQETSDVAMLMASAGGRHAMALGDPLDWALLGDVGFGRVLTEDGVEAIAGLTVDTWQARVGVEGSYTVDMDDGGIFTAFMEVAGRYDGGDDGEVGLELSPGMYIARPDSGFGLELRGRTLVLHSAENYEEYGLSATASVTPRSDGTGLSLSLSPRWGDDTGGADTLWRDESLGLLGSSSSNRNAISLDARVGYGVRAMNGLLTPFSEFGVRDEDSQYWRIGARFNRIQTDSGTLNLELSGERRESLSGDPEHRVGVTSWLRF